jgi:hypothetical protein
VGEGEGSGRERRRLARSAGDQVTTKPHHVKDKDRRLIDRFLFKSIGMRAGQRLRTGKIKVYRFRLYDIASEEFTISNRMATAACIRRIHAEPVRKSAIEIDKKDLNEDGMTEIVFVNA